MKARILIAEDDLALATVIRDNLVFERFHVQWVTDGGQVVEEVEAFNPDLVMLDLSLPGRSGFDVLQDIQRISAIPVIILTASGQRADKIQGFELGADDYITKPFDLEELLARVHAVLRRSHTGGDRLSIGGIEIDFSGRTATKAGRRLHLTHREFEILRFLASRQGSVVHRDELLRRVWGYHEAPFTRSVDHAIARLRKKIEPDPAAPVFIHTVHGDGYCLTMNKD
jgi:DNA-binding response OmpR family regulator